MRRASIVGPLLLIGIGALFLARNVFPDVPLLDYLARYWPFLLIGWGALRLFEILIWSATSKPIPQRGLGPGEWVLIIFLCLFGATLHAVRGFSSWFPRSGFEWGGLQVFGESFDYPVTEEAATNKNPRIVLDGFRGEARITGADVSEVKVTGHTTARAMNQNEADQANREGGLQIHADLNQVTIRHNQTSFFGSARVTADVDITVPKGATIIAHGRGATFDVTGVTGTVDVDGDNTTLRVDDVGGDVRADVSGSDLVKVAKVKGNVELKGHGSDLDLQDIDGTVTITGVFTGNTQYHNLEKAFRLKATGGGEFSAEKVGDARGSLGNITASDLVGPVRFTASGPWDVRMTNFTNSIEVKVNGGDIDLRPGSLPLSRMDVQTRGGQIELALPANAKFDMNAVTHSGSITNNYGDALRVDHDGRRGAQLHGSNGGPPINITTDRGEIVVRTATADDKAPDTRVLIPKQRKITVVTEVPQPLVQ